MEPKPSVGRIVHYKTSNGTNHAALIVQVHNDEVVNLVVWNEFGTQYSQTSCQRGDGPGRWDWPARV